MPPRRERRKGDRLLIGCTILCIVCAIVAASRGGPVLDLDDRTDEIEQLAGENKKRIADNARLTDRVERLSLSNCTDLRDLTQGIYQLVLILEAMVKNGALGPDAKVRIEEPEMVRCGPGDVVPSRP